MPLGLMPGMPYEEKEILLTPADVVLFYSDGIVEAHNSQGEMFGIPRLRRWALERGFCRATLQKRAHSVPRFGSS
jgi:serine phosphatase RsbU (regulator of sigma subunit)